MTQQCTNSNRQFNITEETKIISVYNLAHSSSLCQDYNLVLHKRYHCYPPLVLEELCNKEGWSPLTWEAEHTLLISHGNSTTMILSYQNEVLSFPLPFFSLSIPRSQKQLAAPLRTE